MRKLTPLLTVLALSFFLFGCSEENPAVPVADNQDLADVATEKHGWGDDYDDDHGTANYEVIIENLTPATGPGASQPFSPPILATHKGRHQIYKRGRFATEALSLLAEDAISDPLVDMLNSSHRVHGVAMGDGVILPGGEMRLEIAADHRAKRLSLVFMLVNTNDAFGGLDSVRLPRRGERSFMVKAWDAGSEQNTELMSDIPGPCCGNPQMGTDEHRRVRRHRGIIGDGDLAADMYGWEGAVAKVTVRRID